VAGLTAVPVPASLDRVKRSRRKEPPDPSELSVQRVLLASEGRAIPREAIEFVARIAKPGQASVSVLSIARVHGTAYGFPSPGLLPNKREWQEQRDLVARAVKALRKRGFEADGEVVGTRKATARICQQATQLGCDVIVMAADPPRNRVVADMLWSQEPYRVARKARVPVYLIADAAG
jgi:nucleotide-binding universal stress UspA family protein